MRLSEKIERRRERKKERKKERKRERKGERTKNMAEQKSKKEEKKRKEKEKRKGKKIMKKKKPRNEFEYFGMKDNKTTFSFIARFLFLKNGIMFSYFLLVFFPFCVGVVTRFYFSTGVVANFVMILVTIKIFYCENATKKVTNTNSA